MRLVVMGDAGGEGWTYLKGGVGAEPEFCDDEGDALVIPTQLQADVVMHWLTVQEMGCLPEWDYCFKGNWWVADLDDTSD